MRKCIQCRILPAETGKDQLCGGCHQMMLINKRIKLSGNKTTWYFRARKKCLVCDGVIHYYQTTRAVVHNGLCRKAYERALNEHKKGGELAFRGNKRPGL